MPEPTFRPVTGADRDDLARFLTGHRWPFHVKPAPGPAEAAELVAGWDLDGPSTRAWWLERDGRVVGLLKVEDLGSAWDPSWDLRIAEGHRGAGLGTAAVRRLSGEVFGGWPGVRRIEAQTRRDNLACGRCCAAAGTSRRRSTAAPGRTGAARTTTGSATHCSARTGSGATTTPVDWDEG